MAFRDNNTNTVILDEKTAYAFNTDQPTGDPVGAVATLYSGNNTVYGQETSDIVLKAGQLLQSSPAFGSNQGQTLLNRVDVATSSYQRRFANGSYGSISMGIGVGMGHNLVALGAPYDDATGTNRGRVYVWDMNKNGYNTTPDFILSAADGADGDEFGCSVAIGNGRIVVGANYSDAGGTDSGAAYIYTLSGNLIKKIIPTDSAQQDYLGTSCAIGNGKIVVGAYGNDDNGLTSGSAYIYDLYGNNEIKLNAPDGAAGDSFGKCVAIGNGRIVIGAELADTGAVSNTGAVYVYDLLGNYLFKLTGTGTAEQFFGSAVAVGNGSIVVGEYPSQKTWMFEATTGTLQRNTASLRFAAGQNVAIGQSRAVFQSDYLSDYGWCELLQLNHNTVHYLDLLNETAL